MDKPRKSVASQRGQQPTRFFENALAFSDDQVFLFDNEGRFVYANPAGLALLDVQADELIGNRWADIGASEDTREPFHAAVNGVYSLKKPVRGVIEVSVNGDRKFFEYALNPIMGDRNDVESVIVISRDITSSRLGEEALRADEYFNASLLRLYGLLGQSTTYADIIKALKPEMLEVMGFRNVHILIRADRDSLFMLDTGGPQEEAIKQLMKIDPRFPTKMGDEEFLVLPIPGHPFLEEIARAEDVYVIEDIMSHPLVREEISANLGQHTVVMVPLTLAENKLGFFALTTIGDEKVRMPSARQIDYLRTLANHVAVAMDRVRFLGQRLEAERELEDAYGHLEGLLDDVVGVLASTVSTRDPYTTQHQEGVARLAVAIAREMGLDQNTIDGLRIAATLHDIGKISVPSEILTKPVVLSDMEMGIVRRHPALACELLGQVEFTHPIATIVRQHHERLDGSGYPDGIAGDEMLLESKILAVADVVEAMASYRPYRPALGIDAALSEVEANAGEKFDPDVVAACVRVVRAEGRLP